MKMFFYLVVLCSLVLVCLAGKPANQPRSSVPVPFRRSRSVNGLLFQGTMRKILREMKTSFCSELESVALQLTRPTNTATSLSLIDDLVNFINLEFEDQALMDNVLVKLSRKFAEPNIYTVIKTLLVVHLIMEKSSQNGRETLGNLFSCLRAEIDDKIGKIYFDVDNIEVVAKQASTVQELQAVEFARIYSSYVFEYTEIKSNFTVLTTKLEYETRISELLALKELGENVLKSSADICSETATVAVIQQCCTAITNDQIWLISEINRLTNLIDKLELNNVAAKETIKIGLKESNVPQKNAFSKANTTTAMTANNKKKQNISISAPSTLSTRTVSTSTSTIPKKAATLDKKKINAKPIKTVEQNKAKCVTKTDSIPSLSAVNDDNIDKNKK